MPSRRARWIVGAVLLAMATAALAEEAQSVDRMFEQARDLGRKGKREEARELCSRILERSPEYDDVRVYLGRLHAWDHQYEPARTELRRVLERRPDHLDARLALIDAEMWADRVEESLQQSRNGLAYHTDHPDLLYRKAVALEKLDRYEEALRVAREALRVRSDSREARRLVERLRFLVPHSKVTLEASYESFDDDTEPWRELVLELRRTAKRGSIVGRVNSARRFGDSGVQYEVDGYPKLPGGGYVYLNVGYSDSPIFPDWRFGAEVFRGLGRGFEGSIGFRRLDFGRSSVTLYTGSIGRYQGNYFVWIRPFVADKDRGTSTSGALFIRRYLEGTESYVTLILGAGSTPEERIATQEVIRLDSRRVRVDWQKEIRRRWILKGSAGYRSEEFPSNQDRGSWQVGLGFERLF